MGVGALRKRLVLEDASESGVEVTLVKRGADAAAALKKVIMTGARLALRTALMGLVS